MFDESVAYLCEQINENFASSIQLEGFIVGLGGPALAFAEAAWRVSMVLAAVVFAMVACWELYAISVRTEGTGGPMGSAEVVFKLMFKVAVCYVVLQVSFDLLVGIFGTSNDLTAAFAEKVGASGLPASYSGGILNPDKVADAMPDGFWKGLLCWLCALVVLIISWAAKVIAWGLILIRVLQIYLYLAVSPIPLATLPSRELSQVGKSFLKSFAAVCLQGALIYLVVALFPAIVSTVLSSGGYGAADTVLGLLFISLVYSVAIIVTLAGTQQLARRICGAM